MPRLSRRAWVPDAAEDLVQAVAAETAAASNDEIAGHIAALVDWNRRIHDEDCLNLDPAANTMNPAAEALLSAGLGSRPSLGHPGAKYETGLEAIERIEVIAAELAARVFDARHAEVRLPSGAIANLVAFMAAARPGDPIIVPPATIAGHVTHHLPGAAGRYGLEVHEAPVDAGRYTVDVAGLADLAARVRPAMITIGGSLNLHHHPVGEIRAVADEVGAVVLFDAAHLSGPIAGGAWPNPLREGAHLMTMSTYKSLGGPPAGLAVTDDPTLAERIDSIVFPGVTANFDAAKTAALAVTLLDWLDLGTEHAATMVATATALVAELRSRGIPALATESHAFAVPAEPFRDGDAAARHLRRANLLTSAIGTPAGPAVRIGVNELVRWGMTADDTPEIAALITSAWRAVDDGELASIADEVGRFRRRFGRVHFTRAGLRSSAT